VKQRDRNIHTGTHTINKKVKMERIAHFAFNGVKRGYSEVMILDLIQFILSIPEKE